jgi:hypothetical protein
MRVIMFRVLWFVVVSTAITENASAQTDLTIVSKVKTGYNETPSTEILYLTEGAIRLAQETTDCIIETTTEKVIIIDHAKKEYSETSISEISTAFEKFMPKSRILRKIMARAFSKLSIKKGKTSLNIAGYDCNSYLIWIGEGEFEFWATPKLQPPSSYYIVMEKFFASMGPMGTLNSTIYAELQKRKVMLLATTLLTMRVRATDALDASLSVFGGSTGRTVGPPKKLKATKLRIDTLCEATEVKTEPIPASTFEVPTGYAKTDSPYKTN